MKKYFEIITRLISIDQPDVLLAYENKITKVIAVITLSLGSLANLIFTYFLNENRERMDILNSLFLIGMAMIYIICDRFIKNNKLKSLLYSGFFCLVFMGVVFQYYSFLGPAVWSIAFVAILIAMLKQKPDMLIMMGIVTLGIYLLTWLSKRPFVIDGRYYWVQLFLCMVVILISGAIRELSAQRFKRIVKQMQMIEATKKALKESEISYKAFFEGSSDPIMILKDYKFIECNQATLDALEIESIEEIIGKYPWHVSPKYQSDGLLSEEKAKAVLQKTDSGQYIKFEWDHQKTNGEVFPVEIMMTPIERNHERLIHVTWREIYDRKKLENELKHLSYHDQLTGLYNRRYFEEQLNRLDHSRDLPVTLIMADVNDLKAVNDRYGHAMGDQLLLHVSETLRTEFRVEDIIARIGGDEFAVLLPKTTNKAAEDLLRRLNSVFKEEKIGDVKVTVAFGFETKHSNEVSLSQIMLLADNKMYAHKKTLKN